jgi:hypothetical protein
LPRLFLRLLRHVALCLSARRTRLTHPAQTVGLASRAVVFLLLARRKLAKLLQRLVDLVVRRLLLLALRLTALHSFVLIAKLVLLQLEDVCEILRVRLLAAAATSAATTASATATTAAATTASAATASAATTPAATTPATTSTTSTNEVRRPTRDRTQPWTRAGSSPLEPLPCRARRAPSRRRSTRSRGCAAPAARCGQTGRLPGQPRRQSPLADRDVENGPPAPFSG